MNRFKFALPASILAFFLACSGDFKEITDEERQARLPQLSSSSEDLSSSSSDGQSSEQGSSSSGEHETFLCGGVEYNPETQFCYSNHTVDKCGGKEYVPVTDECVFGVVMKRCASSWYNSQTHFCQGGTTVVPLCGVNEYYASQFCRGSEVFNKCDGREYELTQFCSGSTIINKCGNVQSGDAYNPLTEQCCPSGSKKYITASQFCHTDNEVYSKCGTATYEPATHFCDARESKLYKYKEIGEQVWMAENLNYNANGSRCYGDNTGGDSQNRCSTYGRLYNWATAMNLNSNCNSSACAGQVQTKHQGICPQGWHVPSDAEWTTLTSYVETQGGCTLCAGTRLKAASGWNTGSGYIAGTDNYGFSALPGGMGYSNGTFTNIVDEIGTWWSSSRKDNDSAYFRFIYYNRDSLGWSIAENTRLRSVRCLQN